MRIECSVVSDIGMMRHNNEDNFYLARKYRDNVDEIHAENSFIQQDGVFLGGVFDGMGGEENGELASLLAASVLQKYESEPFKVIINDYVQEANRCICRMIEKHDSGRMGSTLAVVQIAESKLNFCNLGDSPVFLLQNGKFRQISVNHNEAQRMLEMGILTENEVRKTNKRHRLTQHLGIFEDEMILEPYAQENIPLQDNDYVLICSDGLTDMVEEEEIARVLKEDMAVKEKAKVLVELALDNGGYDNVTVMLIHICDK